MKRAFNQEKQLDNCYYISRNGYQVVIDYIYRGERLIWEHIIGYIYTKDNYSLQTNDDYILKCKDQ